MGEHTRDRTISLMPLTMRLQVCLSVKITCCLKGQSHELKNDLLKVHKIAAVPYFPFVYWRLSIPFFLKLLANSENSF
jgi:hypothetical protein